jgi:NAD(P)-dependent dehydrogenase (short-subunit alcohol dehydrogenase family)
MSDGPSGGPALVTGAGQGIGAAIAARLAQDGHRVFVNDVDPGRAAAAVEMLRSRGGAAGVALGDVSDSAAVDRMFDLVEEEAGPVAVLVNNAGVGGNAAIRNVTDDYWDRVLSVDLDGVLYCSRRALGPMREARAGSIVNVTSRAWLGWWGQAAYAAAKAGVVGLTRALAVEMASRNVRVNAVAPGLIETPLLLDRDEDALARLLKSVPIGRLGRPEDVANAVGFLASQRARAITGQILYVCGGKSVYAYPDWPGA